MCVCNASNVAVSKNVPAAVGRYFSVRCKIYKHLGITIFIFVCFFNEIGITSKLIEMFRTSNFIFYANDYFFSSETARMFIKPFPFSSSNEYSQYTEKLSASCLVSLGKKGVLFSLLTTLSDVKSSLRVV